MLVDEVRCWLVGEGEGVVKRAYKPILILISLSHRIR